MPDNPYLVIWNGCLFETSFIFIISFLQWILSRVFFFFFEVPVVNHFDHQLSILILFFALSNIFALSEILQAPFSGTYIVTHLLQYIISLLQKRDLEFAGCVVR